MFDYAVSGIEDGARQIAPREASLGLIDKLNSAEISRIRLLVGMESPVGRRSIGFLPDQFGSDPAAVLSWCGPISSLPLPNRVFRRRAALLALCVAKKALCFLIVRFPVGASGRLAGEAHLTRRLIGRKE